VTTKVGEPGIEGHAQAPHRRGGARRAARAALPVPQCGFSSTVHGNEIARESQAAKLRLIVETAREVWGTS